MSYHHLTPQERGRIEAYHKEGYSISKIAKKIDRNKSTILRELRRTGPKPYQAEVAQKDYEKKRERVGAYTKATDELVDLITEKLEASWSPEQIEGRLLQGKLSFKTIYRWIYLGCIAVPIKVLRQKGKRRKPSEKRGKFETGSSIHNRPKVVSGRTTPGHWEADTIVSSRGKSKGCFATFAERKSRLYLAFSMADRSANSMEEAIRRLLRILGEDLVQTITTDRGKEFACYKNIEKDTPLQMFFADPYSAWQRGTNENSNGLLREFYPKKTDLAKITERELFESLIKLNSRPRKCLDWKTPFEVFQHEVLHLG